LLAAPDVAAGGAAGAVDEIDEADEAAAGVVRLADAPDAPDVPGAAVSDAASPPLMRYSTAPRAVRGDVPGRSLDDEGVRGAGGADGDAGEGAPGRTSSTLRRATGGAPGEAEADCVDGVLDARVPGRAAGGMLRDTGTAEEDDELDVDEERAGAPAPIGSIAPGGAAVRIADDVVPKWMSGCVAGALPRGASVFAVGPRADREAEPSGRSEEMRVIATGKRRRKR
jgi:hypothetical protein